MWHIPHAAKFARWLVSYEDNFAHDRDMHRPAMSPLCLVCLAVRLCVVTSQYFHPSWWRRYGLDQVTCGHARHSSQPFIGNDAFFDVANVTYSPGSKVHTFAGVKIFLHPKDVKEFSKASSSIMKPFVLITRSNLDELVPYPDSDRHAEYLSAYTTILEHKQLVGWYGSNKVLQHPKLTALPLGPKWQWQSTDFHGEDENKGLVSKLLSYYALDVMYNFYGKKRDRLIYLSMTESSSDNANYAPWRGSRRKAAQALRSNFPAATDLATNVGNQPMISNVKGCGGRLELEQYLIELQHYKFVLSPAGNGPDAHRTWEALMMGCIPVVVTGPFDEMYAGLPVLILDSWDELTPKRLERAYKELRYGQQTFSFDSLFTPYWFRMIDKAIHAFSMNENGS